jgi:hypothetical protein
MERRVELWSEGEKLVGTLRVPDGLAPGEKRPAIVCCQGFSLTREVWLPQNAKALNAAGYVTLNIDYRFFGESGGQPRCRLVPQAQVTDVRHALTFLETVPEVDASKLGVFGISLGCSVAASVAGLDARVKALVAIAGPADLERVWSHFPDFPKFRAKVHAARQKYVTTGEVTYVAVPRILSSDPETCALLVADQPKYPGWRLEISFESLEDLFTFKPEDDVRHTRAASLFLAPSEDALISRSELASLHAKAPEPKQLVLLEGLKHHEVYNDGRGFEPVMRHTLAFLGQHLPARPTNSGRDASGH